MTKFENLPITFDDYEYNNGWKRPIKREGDISELLEIWDINDETEQDQMAQVLRHLKNAMSDSEND